MEKWNKNCSLKMRYSPRGEIFGTNHGSGSIDIDFKATNLTLFYKNNVNLEFMCRYSTKSESHYTKPSGTAQPVLTNTYPKFWPQILCFPTAGFNNFRTSQNSNSLEWA